MTELKTTEPGANTLQLPLPPGKTERQAMTEGALNPAINSAPTLVAFLGKTWGSIGTTEAMQTLTAKAQAIHGGDLREAETALISQATVLQALFLEMTRRAGLNMGVSLDATETYMRLALKAQNQSRMTLETLAAIKNPPVVYARQANFANGPQQVNQVNNGVPSATHTAKTESAQNQLLRSSNGERLDFGAQATAGAVDPHMATVGAVHRAQDTRGQGRHRQERRQGRVVAPGARGVEGTTGKPEGAEGGDA
jgi:hypothetical protein